MSQIVFVVILEILGAAALIVGIILRRRKKRGVAKTVEIGRLMAIHAPTTEVPYGAVDVDGLITSLPTITAPISGKPCAVWEVALSESHEYRDDNWGYEPIWTTGRSGDLTLAFDNKMLEKPKPHVVPNSGGTVDIPGHQIRVTDGNTKHIVPFLTFRGDTIGEAEVDARVLAQLEQVGLPAELAAQVRARPARYRVREGAIGTGDLLRVYQVPTSPPRQVPDPDQPFQVFPLSQGAFPGAPEAVGCLSTVIIVMGIVLALCGLGIALPR